MFKQPSTILRADVADFAALPKGGIVYSLDTLTAPADLWRWDANGRVTRLTNVNAAKLAGVRGPGSSRRVPRIRGGAAALASRSSGVGARVPSGRAFSCIC